MLYYAYKLVRGTAAIIVFRGFVIIYIIWWITDLLNMNILSSILGGFIGVGVFAVIIVFQQEIRKFLLLLGSTNFTNRRNVVRYFKFLNQNKSINISEDSPLYKEMRKPQLMLIRHMGFSSFFKNKKTNEIIQDNWRKLNPHRVSRPKAREQYLFFPHKFLRICYISGQLQDTLFQRHLSCVQTWQHIGRYT